MNEAYLKQLAENKEFSDALKEFFLSQKTKLLLKIDTSKMTNENIGQLHRGICDGEKMVEEAFQELRKYNTFLPTTNEPMPGR